MWFGELQKGNMENVLLKYIHEGRIRSIDELKRIYRRIVLKTHPDSIGSNRFVNRFIEFSNFYEEARAIFDSNTNGSPSKNVRIPNHRLCFFQAMHILQSLESPYAIEDQETKKLRIESMNLEAHAHFADWKGDLVELYELATNEYDLIKKQKPSGPYMKHALYFNLRPVFHNIIAYHLTGSSIYRRQIKQNLAAVMLRLEEKQCFSLRDYLQFLIKDMDMGPAVFSME
jgi:hypothetical protein